MKRLLIILAVFVCLFSNSYASNANLEEMENFIKTKNEVQTINLKGFEPQNNATLILTSTELKEMQSNGIEELEINMYYLTIKVRIEELINKGNIKISSDYKDDLYYIFINSSESGKIVKFDTNIEVIIPYDMDEKAYYITMYGVDANEQIVNLRGTMNEDRKTVSVILKNIEVPLIPVVNKIIYKDLVEYSWAGKFIEEAAAKGILSGKEEGFYAPEQYITRAEFVTLLVKVFNLEVVDYNNNFNDINKNDWYYDYVITADYYGLTAGVYENLFLPEASITRQDIVVMVGKALQKFYNSESTNGSYKFIDEEEINDYAVSYLKKCLDMGIVSGYNDGTFKPKAYATRAEAAVIINKVFSIINVF